ncbi:FAD binding domain-containing protein [Paenibacillus sp. NPDC058071]|uniref:FAD binding domain-containing protein n=1 Tax=Paenibacillus sp. NPDC058071 TaxID=3346326 RepID=UPI0036DC1B86
MAAPVQPVTVYPEVLQPKDAAEAWKLKRYFGDSAAYVAGGTLLRTQWESGLVALPRRIIDLSGIATLQDIREEEGGEIRIGAVANLALCRSHSLLQMRYPLVTEAAHAIAAPSIRQLGTIGGNVLSAVGDSLAALLVYETMLHWQEGEAETVETLADWLETASMRADQKDRLLLGITLPKQPPLSNAKRIVAYHKVGRREAFTPSVVTVAMSGYLDEDGCWRQVHIAAGGGQTAPRRLTEAELTADGRQASSRQLLADVSRIVNKTFEPVGDSLVSAEYRRRAAANLIVSELWKASGSFNKEG